MRMLQVRETILFHSWIIAYSALVIVVVHAIGASMMITILRPFRAMTVVQITPVCKVYEVLSILPMHVLSMGSLVIVMSEVSVASVPAALMIESV